MLCGDDGVDIEHIRQLKQSRANAKRELTKAVNRVADVLVVGQTLDDVKAADGRLVETFNNFKMACERYKSVIVDEVDIEECLTYMHEAEARFHDIKERVSLLIHSLEKRSPLRENDIGPEDSVSETKSRFSNSHVSSRSSKNSRKSGKSALQDMMLKNTATKASLLAEASMLEECQDIANEELRLSQRKKRLTLDTKLAKLEAEERICAEFAMATGSRGEICDELLRKPAFETTFQQKTTHSRIHHRTEDERRLHDSHRPPVSFASSRRVDNSWSVFSEQARKKPMVINGEQSIQSSSEFVNPPQRQRSLNPFAPPWKSPAQVNPVDESCNPKPPPGSFADPYMFPPQRNPADETRINTTVNGEEYLDTMKKLTIAALLPKSELSVFDGNPLKYFLFIRSFENNVEKDTCDFSRRLQLLVQFCSGKARRAIEGCILLEPQEGYMKAKQILAERFGDAYTVSNSWLKKVSCGLVIKPGDRESLQELADDLENCEMTLKAAGRITQLNNEDRLVKILERCPNFVKSRWQSRVQEIRSSLREPTVEDVRRLIRMISKEKNDPVFGAIMDNVNREQSSRNDKIRRPNAVSTQRKLNFSIQTNDGKPNVTSSNVQCYFCEQNHKLADCEEFKKKTGEEKFNFIRSKKLCDNCLSSFHFSAGCKQRKACIVPGCDLRRKHLTSIHESVVAHEKRRKEDWRQHMQADSTQHSEKFVGVTSCDDQGGANNGLPIVPLKVKGTGSDKVFNTYALLDSGSTASFCSETLLDKLGVTGRKCQMSLATISGVDTNCQTSVVSLEVMNLEETIHIPMHNVFSTKTMNISTSALACQEDVKRWPHLDGITLPDTICDGEVNLLIGVDVPETLQPEEVRRSEDGGPYAIKTVFGWTLNGPIGVSYNQGNHCFFSNPVSSDDQLYDQLKKYFNHEFEESNVDNQKMMSVEDGRALAVFQRSIQLQQGHYYVSIPWKCNPPDLPNNRQMAQKRLEYLKCRLQKDSNLKQRYSTFIDDLLEKDYARQVPEEEMEMDNGKLWYLPHHSVTHPKKPDKVRIVFDCAAKYKNVSLNDKVLQGPDLTNSLIGVLCRFRKEPIALMADVEAMFHQVRVTTEDVNALRFLWYPHGDLTLTPVEYQMMVHLFGGIWSPSCAKFALRRVAEDNASLFDNEVIQAVRRSFYVDDLLKAVKDADEAIMMQKQLTDLLARGGFHLTKWVSNSRYVLDAIPEDERSKELKNVHLEDDKLPTERALGLQWDVETDRFTFNVNVKDMPSTRRGLLSTISSVYDPLGFISPYILKAKIILQRLCKDNVGWDEHVTGLNLKEWESWRDDLTKLEQIEVKRCYTETGTGSAVMNQLHHFSDASEVGYGAVTYLRSVNKNGDVSCSFVLAKSRLTPLKRVTIPRLELAAATVAVKLDSMLVRELDMKLGESVFWTDSTAVLRYIRNESRRYHTYVGNRIAVIHDGSSPTQWRYVDTSSNAADDASRGLSADSLIDSDRWLHGPEFLRKEEHDWPKSVFIEDLSEDDVEVKKIVQTHSVQINSSNGMTKHVFSKFSDWTVLKKSVAWLLRYKSWLRRNITSSNETQEIKCGRLTTEEMREAECAIVKCVQSECFGEELKLLQSPQKSVRRSSSLCRLDPVILNGVISVGGRLNNAPYQSHEATHQIILPKQHHVSDLIIRYMHMQSAHFGQEYVLACIRERFWIIKARQSVRRIIRSCFDCKRRCGKLGKQKMADLPEDRVTADKPPFSFVGIDCFGPFLVKRGRCIVKRYGVIFTCLTIRAIHLEIVHSMDTDSFINALRRFISRRGNPEEIRCDNGSNFRGGEKELRLAIQQWNQDQVHQFLLQRDIKWIFNPPTASHMGGAWERAIRSVRRALNAILRNQTIDDEGLQTLFCEVEAILNARPLTKVSDDPKDLNAITPNHLLLLRSDKNFPPGVFKSKDPYSKRRWKQVQYMTDIFWKRWTKEYLPTLQVRQKWHSIERNLKENDLVLVVEQTQHRNQWPLGRVLEVYAGRDGLVRSAKVKTMNSEYRRPVTKLCLLEAAVEEDST